MLRNLRDLVCVLAMMGGLFAVIVYGKDPARSGFPVLAARPHQPDTDDSKDKPQYKFKYEVTVYVATDAQGKDRYFTSSRQPQGRLKPTPPLDPSEFVKVGQYLIDSNADPNPKPALPVDTVVRPAPNTLYLFRCLSSGRIDMLEGVDNIVHWSKTNPQVAKFVRQRHLKVIDIQSRDDAGKVGGLSEEFKPWRAAGIPDHCCSILLTDAAGKVAYWQAAPTLPSTIWAFFDEIEHRVGHDMEFKFAK